MLRLMFGQRPPHELFFWTASFFLTGILVASLTFSFSYKLFFYGGSAALLFLLTWFQKRAFAFLAVFVLIGALYFYFFTYAKTSRNISFDRRVVLEAAVTESDVSFQRQILTLVSDKPAARFRAITLRYPIFNVGDRLRVEGVIKKSNSFFVDGILYQPLLEKMESKFSGPAAVKTVLFRLRLAFQNNLKRLLPYNQAIFLSGLTVGGTAGFSPEMEEKFRRSNTTHLMAISGFNIAVIINYVSAFFLLFLGRRSALWLTLPVIFLFVLLTGAEASVVRAALMGLIVVLAKQSGRRFYPRNAIAAAALVMVIFDPRVLVFNLGFQLSFLALMGIIYLKPYLDFFLDKFIQRQFWGREEILLTVAAEAVVMPLLLIRFHYFSWWGIFATPLVAFVIPLTMGLGFLAGAAAFVSDFWGLPFAGLAHILLSYELAVIDFFAFDS